MLIAEDDATAREVLAFMLPRRFPALRLHLAQDGAQGLELFRQHQPRIVVTDIAMPMMDGLEMARRIKALAPETTIFSISAFSSDESRQQAMDAGITHQIDKPLDLMHLFAKLEPYLEALSVVR